MSGGADRSPGLTALDQIEHLTIGFTTSEVVPSSAVPPSERVAGASTVRHIVHHPSLLDQIENTTTTSTTAGEMVRTHPRSKPAGRLECIAFVQRLDVQAASLAREVGVDPDLPLRARLRAIGGVLGRTTHRSVTGWWTAARILTQHEGRPLAPRAPCPVETCDQMGSLRVRFDPKSGLCVACGTVWSDDLGDPVHSFGRLAVWVRWSAEHLLGPVHLDDEGNTCQECIVDRLQRDLRRDARRRELTSAKS